MSLVATWCYCSDGKWYEDPVWYELAEDSKTRSWFLCLDDDDPPELVIQLTDDEYKHHKRPAVPELDYFKITGGWSYSFGRWFGLSHSSPVKQAMRHGVGVFGKLTKVPPPPGQFDSVSEERPDYMGCYYDLRRARK